MSQSEAGEPAADLLLSGQALGDADIMLTRKFGKETVNHFAGAYLNRLSFLRTDSAFLSAALHHPTSRFMLFNNLATLMRSQTNVQFVRYQDISSFVPQGHFALPEEEQVAAFDSSKTKPLVVFLGISEVAANMDALVYKKYRGVPYFAVDITPRGSLKQQAQSVVDSLEAQGHSFINVKPLSAITKGEATVWAQARHYIDWNTRYSFCGSCGQIMLSTRAGTRRVCPPSDAARSPSEREQCPSRSSVSNVCFPRTDPTMIVAVINHDGTRLLLGRQKRYPAQWYTTLAGFVEPGESIEDAVRREANEESGVRVSRVIIHSTQPWPFPETLMIGALGQTASVEDEIISLDQDAELEDANWFELSEVEKALNAGKLQPPADAGTEYQGGLRVPPEMAIAHQLMRSVVEGTFWRT